MICISIREQNFEKCKEILAGNQRCGRLSELRGDLCGFSTSQVEELASLNPNLIITCRSNRAGGSKTEKEALELITAAIRHGAKYADIEIEASQDHLEYIKAYAVANSCKLIISYHNFTGTPSLDELFQIRTLCERKGAAVVKIVTTAHTTEDAMRVLSLYNFHKDGHTVPLIAFAMGEAGRFTRLSCLSLGSPFTYCSIDGAETAPGQYSADEAEQILNPASYPYLFNTQLPNKSATPAGIRIPCSKSISQRAIIAAALSNGTTTLLNYTPCNDSEAAISAITALGCRVERINEDDKTYGESAETLKIFSPGAFSLCKGTEGNNIELNIGESGLLTRLLMPLSAIIARSTGKRVTLNGRGSILNRDLSESVSILKSCGIKYSNTVSNSKKTTLPITIESGFFSAAAVNMDNAVCKAGASNKIVINGACSSQTISGILMALPLQKGNIVVHVENPASVPYLDLTVEVLKKFSVVCKKTTKDKDIEFAIAGNQEYTPCEYRLAADWSSAAYFKVLQTLGANINIAGISFGSNQADEAITNVCNICSSRTNDTRQLSHFNFDATDCPDLFPVLSVLALFCNGTSTIKGVHRLAEKESNRAESICSELLKTGVKIYIENDSLIIEGDSKRLNKEGWDTKRLACTPLLFDTHNDHRIAMSLIVLSCKLPVPVRLNNIKCIEKSFPRFIDLIKTVLHPK
mgnify:FL=1